MHRFLATIALGAACLAALTTDAGAATMGTVGGDAAHAGVPVYVARPDGDGPFPAVVFLHGCGGMDGFDAVAADRLATHKYVAVVLDELGLTHPGGACESGGQGQKDEAAAARTVLRWLRAQPWVAGDKLGLVGFSMGGNAILDLIAARSPAPLGLRAAVAFYPSCTGASGAHVAVPLAIFDGDADRIAPAAACAAFAKAATIAGKPVEQTIYPGATHAFNVPGPDRTLFGEPVRFDEKATYDSALRTLRFLDAHMY